MRNVLTVAICLAIVAHSPVRRAGAVTARQDKPQVPQRVEVTGQSDKFTITPPSRLEDGATSIAREPGNNFVTVTFDTNRNVDERLKLDLPLVAGGVPGSETAPAACSVPKPGGGFDTATVKFQCEVFQRIIPPPGAPPTEEQPLSNPVTTAIRPGLARFAKPTVIIASGRFYMHGFISQVITSWEEKLTQKDSSPDADYTHGVVVAPEINPDKGLPEGKSALPRYDTFHRYPTQWVILGDTEDEKKAKIEKAVVMYDSPGLNNFGGGTALFGTGVKDGDRFSHKVKFEVYIFEDADLDPKTGAVEEGAEYFTHRVNWELDITIDTANDNLNATKGKVGLGPAPNVVAAPLLLTATSYLKAANNDPKKMGWRSKPGNVKVTKF